jgi:acetolactate synthase-1/2/3 large subunit
MKDESVAEAYLALLRHHGIDFLYMGAGTDTAPVVEAYARLQAEVDADVGDAQDAAARFPEPVIAVHENLAVGMAHGHTMVSGRPQAVMLHVSVGAANAVCAIMNAARSQVPMLFTAGRTPLFEAGPLGARSQEIHWAQEMFDQAGMLRELVKWDYELRDGVQLRDVVERALSVAMTHPRGPVYLSLPREVLAKAMESAQPPRALAVPLAPHPDPAGVERLAEQLHRARFPVIVCTASGADPATVAALQRLCETFGIGVVEANGRFVNFPTRHPLHLGRKLADLKAHADAYLFLESDVPWLPATGGPPASAFVAHAATDPGFAGYPMRSFRSDLSLTTSVRGLLPALAAALEGRRGGEASAHEDRRRSIEAVGEELRAKRGAARDAAMDGPITKAFLSHCIDVFKPADAMVVNEYSLQRDWVDFDLPGTYFGIPPSAGLGWGFPAALGAQQAAPGRMVIGVFGDGAYLFANPAACHQAAEMHGLPVLTIVFNNQGWAAVQSAALAIYPDAHAAAQVRQGRKAPLVSIAPVPDFERYVEASRGHGERVTTRDALLPALHRAAEAVRSGRQALVNVMGV